MSMSLEAEEPPDTVASSGDPIPIPSPTDPRREVFDPAHYRAQLDRKQRRRLDRSGDDGLADYLASGWLAGLDPSPSFSTEGYLHDNPDVAAAGIDPLTHWVRYGRAEGRVAVSPAEFADPDRLPRLTDDLVGRRDAVVDHLTRLGVAVDPIDLHAPLLGVPVASPAWFDESYYLASNPDVARSGADPLQHFVRFGFRERRRPNPDIARRIGPDDSPIDQTLAARDVRIDTRNRLAGEKRRDPSSASVVVDAIRAAMVANDRHGLILAFGHDDFTRIVGGIQLCEGLEQREFGRRDHCYVFIHPSVSLRSMHPADGDALVRISVDGVGLDHEFRLGDLAREWTASGSHDLGVDAVVVHSIIGHSPEHIGALVRSVAPRRCVWWLHDRMAKCPNWHLMRNGVEPCGGPPVTSLACRLCASGGERPEHLRRLGELWSLDEWVFVAPSDSAAEAAMSGSAVLSATPIVVPHLELRRSPLDRPAIEPGRAPVRVGFIGEPRTEKGWDTLVALVASNPGDLEFVHLGTRPGTGTGIEFVLMEQTADTFGASVATIAALGLDAALVWPRWSETFSFVTAEAIAGGCDILTHPASGNVVAMAERHGRAVVFESVDALLAGDVAELLRSRRTGPTPAWEIGTAFGLTPAVLDRIDSAAVEA